MPETTAPEEQVPATPEPETAEAQEVDRPKTIVELAEEFREELKHIEEEVRRYAKSAIKQAGEPLYDVGECIAQATLALRHIEDARMRMGKVIQYAETGKSVYPR